MSNPISEALAGWRQLLSSKVNEEVSSGDLRDHFATWPTNQIPAIVCGQIAIAAGEAAKVWLMTSGGKDSSGANLIVQSMAMDSLGNEIVDALIEDMEEFERDAKDPQRRRGFGLLYNFMKRNPEIFKAVVELCLEETKERWSVDELSKSLSSLRR